MKDLVLSRRMKIALMVESGQLLKQNMRKKDDSENKREIFWKPLYNKVFCLIGVKIDNRLM